MLIRIPLALLAAAVLVLAAVGIVQAREVWDGGPLKVVVHGRAARCDGHDQVRVTIKREDSAGRRLYIFASGDFTVLNAASVTEDGAYRYPSSGKLQLLVKPLEHPEGSGKWSMYLYQHADGRGPTILFDCRPPRSRER